MKKKMITFLLTAAMGFAALSPATVQAADNSIATYATESTQEPSNWIRMEEQNIQIKISLRMQYIVIVSHRKQQAI